LADLYLGVLGDLQRVIDLDSEIPDGAFELRTGRPLRSSMFRRQLRKTAAANRREVALVRERLCHLAQ